MGRFETEETGARLGDEMGVDSDWDGDEADDGGIAKARRAGGGGVGKYRAGRAGRVIGRRNVERVGRETLVNRAAFLAAGDRALIVAHLDRGMSRRELAALHGVSGSQMRRRIDRLRNMLSDPCFVLAAEFGRQLPGDSAGVARAFWIEGRSQKEVAERFGLSIHGVRRELGVARALLLVAMAGRDHLPAAVARAALTAGCRSRGKAG